MTVYFPKRELSSGVLPWDAHRSSGQPEQGLRGLFLCPKAKLGCSWPGCPFLVLQFAPSQLYQEICFGEEQGDCAVPWLAELLHQRSWD